MDAPKLIAESPIGFKVFPEVDQLHVFPGWLACITTLSIPSTPVKLRVSLSLSHASHTIHLFCLGQNELHWRGDTARLVIFYSCIPLKFARFPPGWRIVTHHFSHQGTLATWNLVRLRSFLSSRPAQPKDS